MKYMIGFVLLVFALYWIVMNYSITSTAYACAGYIEGKENLGQTSIHFKLGKARWWVKLWSDSYGEMNAELPNQFFKYYSDIKEARELLLVYDFNEKQVTNFSRLSKILKIELQNGIFNGSYTKHEVDS